MFNITKRITITELTTRSHFKDNETTLKWLKKKGIPFKKVGRNNVVFDWHIQLNETVELADELKECFPGKWENILAEMITDKRLLNIVFQIIPPSSNTNAEIKGRKSIKQFIK